MALWGREQESEDSTTGNEPRHADNKRKGRQHIARKQKSPASHRTGSPPRIKDGTDLWCEIHKIKKMHDVVPPVAMHDVVPRMAQHSMQKGLRHSFPSTMQQQVDMAEEGPSYGSSDLGCGGAVT